MNTKKNLWINDIRPAPKDIWIKTVSAAIVICMEESYRSSSDKICLCLGEVSLDHDAGKFGPPDYIRFLEWLEEKE